MISSLFQFYFSDIRSTGAAEEIDEKKKNLKKIYVRHCRLQVTCTVEDVERGAGAASRTLHHRQIQFSNDQILVSDRQTDERTDGRTDGQTDRRNKHIQTTKFWLVSPNFFGFRQDRQTDRQTDRRTDAVSIFWAFLVLKNLVRNYIKIYIFLY